MDETSKISPAFESYFQDSRPRDRREAIVLLSSAVAPAVPPREAKWRAQMIKQQTAEQASFRDRLMRSYAKAIGSTATSASPSIQPLHSSVLPVVTAEVTRSSLAELAKQEEVVAILPNQPVRLIQPERRGYEGVHKSELKDKATWGLAQLEVTQVWEKTKGAGINVAVLDTGVHAEHPALAGRIKDFVIIDPLGRRVETNPPFDAGQHGTHVCGTIAGGKTPEGVAIGMAPEANLLVGGVLVGDSTLRTLMEGIAWAVEQGADVINMSLGFSYYEPLFAEVLNVLIDQYGVLPVVAIGNGHHGNTSSPGNVYSAFAVGAVEKSARGKLEVAFFSGGASLTFPEQDPNALVIKPDVVAPGVQIYSCVPPERQPDGIYEYSYMDGTSMATPHVAGAAALLMAAKPEVSVRDIIRVLKETARHPDGPSKRPDNRWGYGIIRPLEALQTLA